MVDLRPLTLGEIIDRSATIWRTHWKALFKLFLGVQLASYILMKAWELVGKKYFPITRGGAQLAETLKADPLQAVKQISLSAIGFVAIMAISGLGSYFIAVASTRYIYPQMVGGASTLSESMRFAWTRAGAIFGFFLLMAGWTLLISSMLVLPGALLILPAVLGKATPVLALLAVLGSILVLVGLVVAILWFILRFMLGAQPLALEDVGSLGAFRRSDALSSGRVGPGFLGLTKVRLTIVFTVVAVIYVAVTMVFAIPEIVIQFMYANPFNPAGADLDKVPALLAVPAELLQVVAQTVVTPLLVVFDIVFYVDMRVRREGLDLELKLKEAQP